MSKYNIIFGNNWYNLLQIILIVLKVTGLTNISWWWVFAPTLIIFGLCILFVLFYILVVLYTILRK